MAGTDLSYTRETIHYGTVPVGSVAGNRHWNSGGAPA